MNLLQKIFCVVYKLYLHARYKVILLLIGDMPVIANCVVDTTVIEKNIIDSIGCICYNNKLVRSKYHYDTPIKQDTGSPLKVERKGNTFYLTI